MEAEEQETRRPRKESGRIEPRGSGVAAQHEQIKPRCKVTVTWSEGRAVSEGNRAVCPAPLHGALRLASSRAPVDHTHQGGHPGGAPPDSCVRHAFLLPDGVLTSAYWQVGSEEGRVERV